MMDRILHLCTKYPSLLSYLIQTNFPNATSVYTVFKFPKANMNFVKMKILRTFSCHYKNSVPFCYSCCEYVLALYVFLMYSTVCCLMLCLHFIRKKSKVLRLNTGYIYDRIKTLLCLEEEGT